jgi:hypothetical protein
MITTPDIIVKLRLLHIVPKELPSDTVGHYVGFPPELTDRNEARQRMGKCRFLVIEERPDGVFLLRYSARHECVGDTWHMNVDDAKSQAAYEFGSFAQGWEDVPTEVDDALAFAETCAQERQ